MTNRWQLIGALLIFSSALDAVIAYFFVPPDLQIYLYGAAALIGFTGIALLLKGLATPVP